MMASAIMLNEEVAELLRMNPCTLRLYLCGKRKVKAGELDFLQAEHYKIGKTWMWPRASLERVLRIA